MEIMNRSKFFLSGLFVAVFLCLSAGHVCAEDEIVARVGNVVVTDFEVSRQIQRLMPFFGAYHGNMSEKKMQELREKAIERLIEKAYMVNAALEKDMKVSKAEIDRAVAKIREKSSMGQEFDKALGKEGMAALRESLNKEMLARNILKETVEDRIDVSDKRLRNYYDNNKQRFKRPPQFRVSQILVKVDPSSAREEWEKKRLVAEELSSRARSGEDFYDLAYNNSDDKTRFVGGDLGYFHLGRIYEEIENELVKMKVGDVSGPIRTIQGFHVVKLTAYEPETQMDYPEIKARLAKDLRDTEFEQLKADWLNALREKYQLEYPAK